MLNEHSLLAVIIVAVMAPLLAEVPIGVRVPVAGALMPRIASAASSGELGAGSPPSGSLQANWNAYMHRHQKFINQGALIAYAESPDGLKWSQPSILHDFREDPDHPSVYIAAVGTGEEAQILGKEFYIPYTRSPAATGWQGASVHRFDDVYQ